MKGEILLRLEQILENYFEEREGEGSFASLRSVDLLEEGIIDSLDMVELAEIISNHSKKTVNMGDSSQFNALRTIDGILDTFGP